MILGEAVEHTGNPDIESRIITEEFRGHAGEMKPVIIITGSWYHHLGSDMSRWDLLDGQT